jgi:hypothetical protein
MLYGGAGAAAAAQSAKDDKRKRRKKKFKSLGASSSTSSSSSGDGNAAGYTSEFTSGEFSCAETKKRMKRPKRPYNCDFWTKVQTPIGTRVRYWKWHCEGQNMWKIYVLLVSSRLYYYFRLIEKL